jgi:hypothetical protein
MRLAVLICLFQAQAWANPPKLSICDEDDDDEWYVCNQHGRPIGENRFIRSYHEVTGRVDLDLDPDYTYMKKPMMTASIVAASFGTMAALSFGFASRCVVVDGKSPCPAGIGEADMAFAIIGIIGSFATITVGFPVAASDEPRNRHQLTRKQTQAAVDAYNAALR